MTTINGCLSTDIDIQRLCTWKGEREKDSIAQIQDRRKDGVSFCSAGCKIEFFESIPQKIRLLNP